MNPSEYDLSELRDAIQEAARSDAKCTGGSRPSSYTTASPSCQPQERGESSTPDRPDQQDGTFVDDHPERVHSRQERSNRSQRPGLASRNDRPNSDQRPADARGQRPEPTPGRRRHPPTLRPSRTDGGGDRPYLSRVPGGYEAQLEVFEWLERLIARAGPDATREALEYYESVGWLSKESQDSLGGFVDGLAAAAPSNPRPLSTDDHRLSLHYVARLSELRGA
jgi:archaellum component FlaD/FlaE